MYRIKYFHHDNIKSRSPSTFPRHGNSTVYRHRHRDTNRTEITYHVSLHHVSLHHVISRIGQVIPSHHMNHIATYHVQTQQLPKLQTCFKASYWTNPAALLIPTVRSWLCKKGIAALGHFGSLGSFHEGRVKIFLGNWMSTTVLTSIWACIRAMYGAMYGAVFWRKRLYTYKLTETGT